MRTRIDTRHKQIGGKHRAESRYAMILYRVTNTQTRRNKHYQGVKVLISKEDFLEWFMKNDFEGCSVDRIDRNGHYEIANMQLIPRWLNTAKDKIKHANGACVCFRCKQEKPSSEFVKEARRKLTGLSTVCKKCEATRRLPKTLQEQSTGGVSS